MEWKSQIRQDCDIWYRDQRLSGQSFCHLIDHWQRRLQGALNNYPEATTIALKENNDLDTLAIVIAAQSEKTRLLLLAATLSTSEELHLLEQSQATILIDQSAVFRTVRTSSSSQTDHNGGILFQSSGSTGKPKIIFQNWDHLELNAHIASSVQKLDSHSRALCALSLCHTGGLNVQLLGTLLSGGSLCLSAMKSGDFFRKVKEFSPTHTVLVPNQLDMYASALEKLDKHSFDCIATGSTPVLKTHWDLIKNLSRRACAVYGLTEAGPYALVATEYREPIANCVSYLGRPVGGYSVRVDPDSHEIYLRGPTVSKCPEVTTVDGWFNTQDLGVQTSDGVYFMGRKNRSFKSFGCIVYPESIEAVLLHYSGIVDVRIVPYFHRSHGPIIHALIVGEKSELTSLKRFLKSNLSRQLWPRKFTFLQSLPKTLIYKTLAPAQGIEDDAS